MKRRAWWILGLGLVASTSGAAYYVLLPPKSQWSEYEDFMTARARLPRPTLTFSSSAVNCSSSLIVDANGHVWSEHGCEAHTSGLVDEGQLDDARRARLARAVEKLEQAERAREQTPCKAGGAAIGLQGPERTKTLWRACEAVPMPPEANEVLTLMRPSGV